MDKILVTGGKGFLGKHLQDIKPNWIYVDSYDADLRNLQETYNLVRRTKPDAIIHLAAMVGGIQSNSLMQEKFYSDNMKINLNILDAAKLYKIPRFLGASSTCACPDIVNKYPFSEEDLHNGAPHISNLGYGYAKRMLIVQCNSIRNQYGLDYSTFCPSNLYGEKDNFNEFYSHFIPAAIKKFYNSNDEDEIEFFGTGNPLKQELYVRDLATIIPILLEKHHTDIPLIISPNEIYSIQEIINILKDISNKNVFIKFNGLYDGQYRKDGSNKKLIQLIGNFDFTLLKTGIENTYKWYAKQGENR